MDVLNVVYACDDNYAPYACVSMCSLLENNRKDFDEINIYVVLSQVTQDNTNRLRKQSEEYHANFIPVDAQEVICEIKKLKMPEYRGSYATNFRLFFHKYIKSDVEKFFYLDCDTIVLGSLKGICQHDMGDKCACVVQDALTSSYKLLLGFKPEEPYFNAGVMFIDVRNWKKNNCTEHMIEHLKYKRSTYCNPDQDLLNIELKNMVEYIDPEYNFQPIHRMLSNKTYNKIYINPSYYSAGQLEYAQNNPVILHTYRFLGEFPWHAGNRHPDTEIFDSYMKKSYQKDYVKKVANVGTIMKIEKMMYLILPGSLFFRIFKKFFDIDYKRRNQKYVNELNNAEINK